MAQPTYAVPHHPPASILLKVGIDDFEELWELVSKESLSLSFLVLLTA